MVDGGAQLDLRRWEIDHIGIREVIGSLAEALELDPDRMLVSERGTQLSPDDDDVLGWVRFSVLDVDFIAYFAPDRPTVAWLEAPAGPDGQRLRFGPVSDWASLQDAARRAEEAVAIDVDAAQQF